MLPTSSSRSPDRREETERESRAEGGRRVEVGDVEKVELGTDIAGSVCVFVARGYLPIRGQRGDEKINGVRFLLLFK